MKLRILASGITDLRHVEARLAALGLGYDIERESMASPQARDRFHRLCAAQDWHSLPMFFDGKRLIGGEQELWEELQGPQRETDRLTRALTWAGVLPFVAGALGLWLAPQTWLAAALAGYGWLTLSFMAGSHWGQAGSDLPGVRAATVLFPLIAWAALYTLPPALLHALQALLFAALLPLDRLLLQRGRSSTAYWHLRRNVTAVVVLAQIVAFLAHVFAPS